MAVRTAYVGTEAVGDVLTKANFDKLPGGWIGELQVTANQGSIGTIVDLTGLSVAVTVGANRKIRIKGWCTFFNAVAGVNTGILYIREGATTLVDANVGLNTTGAFGDTQFAYAEAVLTAPSAGAHTYKLSAAFATGAANSMTASATRPALILVEDIGPSA